MARRYILSMPHGTAPFDFAAAARPLGLTVSREGPARRVQVVAGDEDMARLRAALPAACIVEPAKGYGHEGGAGIAGRNAHAGS